MTHTIDRVRPLIDDLRTNGTPRPAKDPSASTDPAQFQETLDQDETVEAETAIDPGHAEADAAETLQGADDEMTGNAPISAQTPTGSLIAAAREALSLSEEDIERQINLPVSKVRAIEAMDIASLPPAPYTLGFVRSYATLLELPADALVERFRQEANYPAAGQTPVISAGSERDLGNPARTSLMTILVVLLVVTWVSWQIIQNLAPDEPLEIAGTPMSIRTQSAEAEVVSYEAETSLASSTPLAPGEAPPSPELPEIGPRLVDVTGQDGANDGQAGNVESIVGSAIGNMLPDQATGGEGALAQAASGSENLAGANGADASAAAIPSQADDLNAAKLAEIQADEPLSATPPFAQAAEAAPADQDLEPIAIVPETAYETVRVIAAPETPPAAEATAGTVVETVVDENVGAEAPVEAPATAQPPVVRLSVEPVYPSRCETSAAASETVTVGFVVSRYGKVTDASVVESSNRCFNRAALSAISRWDFSPATEAGRAVQSQPRTTRFTFQRPGGA